MKSLSGMIRITGEKFVSNLETIIIPRVRDLGDGFQVRRALPAAERRMVGPFVFLDQMGPTSLAPGKGLDVRPHPHIGLATVTWLLEGEILHRDSLGYVQTIRPGEVNWMTAGRGIVHSERSDTQERKRASSLYGLQCWVALPQVDEECEPDFTHQKASELSTSMLDGAHIILVAGSFMGMQSTLPTRSPLVYAQLTLQPSAYFSLPAEYAEQALYIVSGEIECGVDGVHSAGCLLVIRTGAGLEIRSGSEGAVVMILGGEPLDGSRTMAWNFVSSSEERIQQASDDWLHQRFATVPGESEFIPLPDALKR
jgi:redox-sensitive bicupin YhaK (pirin superfamily)